MSMKRKNSVSFDTKKQTSLNLYYNKNLHDKKTPQKDLDLTVNELNEFKILTINVGGQILDTNKLAALKMIIKSESPDIVFIQEPKIHAFHKKKINREFSLMNYRTQIKERGKELAEKEGKEKKIKEIKRDLIEEGKSPNIGVTNLNIVGAKVKAKGGLITLISNKWTDKIEKQIIDEKDFRFLITPFQLNEGTIILLINVYAPSGDLSKNNHFFERLENFIKKKKSKLYENEKTKKIHLIIGGDMNAIRELIDKKVQDNLDNFSGFKNFIANLDLVDIFREENNAKQSFTCFRAGSQTENRIDYILVSRGIASQAKSEIFPLDKNLSADHAMVKGILLLYITKRENIDHTIFKPLRREIVRIKDKHKLKKFLEVEKVSDNKDVDDLYKSFLDGIEMKHFSVKKKAQALYEKFHNELKKSLQKSKEGPNRMRSRGNGDGKFINDFKFKMLKDIKNKLIKIEKEIEKEKEREREEERGESEKVDLVVKIRDQKAWEDKFLKINRKLLSISIKKIIVNKNRISESIKKIKHEQNKRKERMKSSKFVSLVDNMKYNEIQNQRKFFKSLSGETEIKNKINFIQKNILNEEGKEEKITITDPEKIRDEEWPEYTKNIFNTKKDEPEEEGLPYAPIYDINNQKDFNINFDKEHLHRIFKKMAEKKSPGPDEIQSEVYKCLTVDDMKIVESLLEFSWNEVWIPEEWRKCLMTHIEKNSEVHLLDNFRPVSLLDTSYKAFTSLIHRPLYEYISQNNIISDFQFGFMKGRSIQQEQMIFTAIIEDCLENKKSLFGIFLDFRKAFDSMEIWCLIRTLKYYGVPEHLIKLIDEIYKGNHAELLTPLGKSKARVDILRGIRQGDVLSPLLFIIFINPLLKRLEAEGIGYELTNSGGIRIPHLSYADDLNLFPKSIEETKKAMNIVSSFCEFTGMRLNLEKTFGSILSENKEDGNFIIEFNEKPIKMKTKEETFRFLGAQRNLTMNWSAEQNRLKSSLMYFLDQIRNKKLSVRQNIVAINRIAIPRIATTMSFVKLDDGFLTEMDKLTADHLKKKLHLQWNTSNDRLFNENTWKLQSIKELQQIRLVSSIIHQGVQSKSKVLTKVILSRLLNHNKDPSTIKYVKQILKIEMGCEISENNNRTQYELDDFFHRSEMERFKVNFQPISIMEGDTIKYLFASDGSFKENHGENKNEISTSSAIVMGKNWTNDHYVKTNGVKSGFNAEIQAYEIFGMLIKIIEDKIKDGQGILLLDSLSVIQAIKKDDYDDKDMNKNNNGAAIKRARDLYKQSEIELVWIPSHIDEKRAKGKLTDIMEKQILYLKKRFGDKNFSLMKRMNEKADRLAELGHDANQREARIAPNHELIITQGKKIWEGNMNEELKIIKLESRKIRLEKLGPKNRDDISEEYTFNLFREKGVKEDRAQEILMRMMHGGLKSLNNKFNKNCSGPRQKIIHDTNYYTDLCEIHGTLAETQHIIFNCKDAETEQDKLIKKINRYVEIFTEEGQEIKIKSWWENNTSSYETFIIENQNEEEERDDAGEEDAAEEIHNIIIDIGNKKKRKRGADLEEGEEEEEAEEIGGERTKKRKKANLEEKERDGKLYQLTIDDMILGENNYEEIKKILIEKEKIGNENLKRKREEGEERNKRTKKKKKTKLTVRELGSKGFITRELLETVLKIAKNDEEKAKKIIIEIQIYFMKYVERMHKAFWNRHYAKLNEEGIDNNVIFKDLRDTGFT